MSTQSNTLTRNKDLGLLVWLSYNRKWAYRDSAISTYEEKEIDHESLKSGIFNLSSKSLQKFLEEEEEGSIF